MSRKNIVPYFPAPPREYNQSYFAQIIRAFALYTQQVQNPGDGRFTTVTLTNTPTSPSGLEAGTIWQRNGQLLLAPDAGGVPVTKTANFTVADGERWLINNKTGSSCTVTLPTASSWSGREITIKNLQAQTVVSASSNVVPIGGTVAGTAILAATVGVWATLVSDGTNWIIMSEG
jgi:hypothetical protein